MNVINVLSKKASCVRKCGQHFVRFESTSSGNVSPNGPLTGVKVLDLTRIIAGPFCSQFLGDYGADVIKVELADVGDGSRKWGPFFHGDSCMFLGVNRNKQSIGVNFKDKRGQEIIRELACMSDVLIENYKPGDLDRYRLGYKDISSINKSIIYCSLTAFGENGPLSRKKGYNLCAEGLSGLMHMTGEPDGEPVRHGIAITDVFTGIYGLAGITTALYQREKEYELTGELIGQHVKTSLLETGLSATTHASSNYFYGKKNPKRIGNNHPNIVPNGSYPTKDSYIILGTWNDEEWPWLCDALGGDMLNIKNDPKFNTLLQRVENRKEFDQIFKSYLQTQTTQYWIDKIEKSEYGQKLVYAPIQNIQEAFSHPQAIAQDMVTTMPYYQETTEEGSDCKKLDEISVPCVGLPIKLSRTPGTIRRGPPKLGQHTRSILSQWLGFDDSTIETYEKEGIISCQDFNQVEKMLND